MEHGDLNNLLDLHLTSDGLSGVGSSTITKLLDGTYFEVMLCCNVLINWTAGESMDHPIKDQY